MEGSWCLGRALEDGEVFGRQEAGVWGRVRGPAGTKMGCKEAGVAPSGSTWLRVVRL